MGSVLGVVDNAGEILVSRTVRDLVAGARVAMAAASLRVLGWRSRQLLGRYRGAAPAERPRAEWVRLGDRL